jgi:hypothetical protein
MTIEEMKEEIKILETRVKIYNSALKSSSKKNIELAGKVRIALNFIQSIKNDTPECVEWSELDEVIAKLS